MLLKYRRDIDGLRAFAVIAVILYHAFPKVIKGGFIGVDIFFVISGYLISSIIFKSLKNNNFSFFDFYARRIKRIYPALLLVLAFCLSFGWITLTDKEYIQLGKHTLASSLFYTNFTLAGEAGYFDNISNTKPLLHLWSLSIEEQFYIIWPFILYWGWKKGLNILTICFTALLISLSFSVWSSIYKPIKAFYLPQNRIWELISGSLLAYFTLEKLNFIENFKVEANRKLNLILFENNAIQRDTTLRNTLSILGFTINLICIIFLKKAQMAPAFYAVITVLSTLMIIAAGEESCISKYILSRKIFVWIGLISYPLYLWHWPLLSLAYILEGAPPKFCIIIVILVINLLLAWLTYKFFEKPIRGSSEKKVTFITLFCLLVILGVFGYIIQSNNGYQLRAANIIASMPKPPQLDDLYLDAEIDCNSFERTKDEEVKTLITCIKNSSLPKFAILGDSHTYALTYAFVYNKYPNFITLAAEASLPFLNYFNYNKKILDIDKFIDTARLRNQQLNKILEHHRSLEHIILLSRGPLYISGKGFGIEEEDPNMSGWLIKPLTGEQNKNNNKENYVEGYVELINFLISLGKKVIFAVDIPELGIDPKSCIKRAINPTNKNIHNCLIDKKEVDARQKEYRELIAEIQKRCPSLLVYDPTPAFCDELYCYGKKGDIIYYNDDDHLNVAGAQILYNHFMKWLEQNL
jgi:peptidoglycan/LPS O-acetylase OafA/YrhL